MYFRHRLYVVFRILQIRRFTYGGNAANPDVAITEANFPDDTFREYVRNNFDTDENGALSAEEIANVTTVDVRGDWQEKGNIASLKGIEHFTALTLLYCNYNQITALDVSKNTALTSLLCSGNELTELDVSNNTALTWLSCYNNQLTELDITKNTALLNLYCSGNQITALDISKNTVLTTLLCGNDQLTALDVSKNTALTRLWCSNN